MKIAAITDDGKTISQHFGRAAYYQVVTIEDGQIVDRQLRNKLGHAHFANQPHDAQEPGQPHGMDSASHNKHLQMSEVIADCEALLCGGMGMGAYQSMVARGIKPVVTEIIEVVGSIPFDGTITRAMVNGEPVTEYQPSSPASLALIRLWQQVVNTLISV